MYILNETLYIRQQYRLPFQEEGTDALYLHLLKSKETKIRNRLILYI